MFKLPQRPAATDIAKAREGTAHTPEQRTSIVAALYEVDADSLDPAHFAFATASGLVAAGTPEPPPAA